MFHALGLDQGRRRDEASAGPVVSCAEGGRVVVVSSSLAVVVETAVVVVVASASSDWSGSPVAGFAKSNSTARTTHAMPTKRFTKFPFGSTREHGPNLGSDTSSGTYLGRCDLPGR